MNESFNGRWEEEDVVSRLLGQPIHMYVHGVKRGCNHGASRPRAGWIHVIDVDRSRQSMTVLDGGRLQHSLGTAESGAVEQQGSKQYTIRNSASA